MAYILNIDFYEEFSFYKSILYQNTYCFLNTIRFSIFKNKKIAEDFSEKNFLVD